MSIIARRRLADEKAKKEKAEKEKKAAPLKPKKGK
jgi:hypothetical protein